MTLEQLVDRISSERFDITREWAQVPYLTRWSLLGRRTEGNWAVYLHRFQRSDYDELHDHPWPFVSVILSGGYWEETPGPGWREGNGPRVKRWYGSGRVLYRPANWIHRVVIPDGKEAWTLILRLKKVRGWGFWCPASGFTPWRVHLANAERTGSGCPT
jgi:hypothetical protein